MSTKLNILFLASWYPNQTSPQAGNFIQKHAQAVAQQCNVVVLHAVSRKQQEDFFLEKREIQGVLEVVVYYRKISSQVPVLSNYQKFKAQLAAYLEGFKIAQEQFEGIDLVHVNVTFPAGIFALHLKKKFNLPFIITEQWTAFLKIDPTPISIAEKYYIKKITHQAEMICPVSEDLKVNMQEFGINNSFEVIANLVDTDIFHPNLTNKHKETRLRILHVSNLKDEHKNITGILKTIKQLSLVNTDFVMTIAGNGDVEKFKKLAKELKIPEELICFEGDQTTEEVAQLMNQHDCFLLFSNYETFSVVVAEAWMCGLPVIASQCGGLTEVITSKNGIQIPIKDRDALLKAIIELQENFSQYNREEIATDAVKKYSKVSVGNHIVNIYKKVLSQLENNS